jgi:hypothetical protein
VGATVLTPPSRARPRLTRPEAALLAVFAAASFSVFAANAVDAALHNRVFLGADGSYAPDQLQYLAWSTDAAHHGLSANLYAFGLGDHVFVHPVWLLTGLLHVDAGLSYPLLVAVWKLAAIGVLFSAVRAYARSQLGGGDRAVAVVMLLALFMATPAYLLAHQSSGAGLLSVETFAVYWVNGYFPIALAVAAMVAFLLQVPALVEPGARRRTTISYACAAGLAASWLHPWQGAELLAILVALIAWERPSWRRHRALLAPAAAAAAPLVYYAILARSDAGWKQAEHASAAAFTSPGPLPILLALIVPALLMAPGYAGRASTPAERILRLWPGAIAVVHVLSPGGAYHALGGLSVPASVLIVNGWPWLRARLRGQWPRRAAIAAVCLAMIAAPAAAIRRVTGLRSGGQSGAQIPRYEARALDWIARSKTAGGVLSTAALGAWAPAVTDRATWVGHPMWSPRFDSRAAQAELLFSGAADRDPAAERAFVLSTGAAFVLEPCGRAAQLARALAPAGFTAVRIGCATVYWPQTHPAVTTGQHPAGPFKLPLRPLPRAPRR